MTALEKLTLIEHGSPEWYALRKTKITATDAPVIVGASHWKTKLQLYHEKMSNDSPVAPNDRMQRGIDLEPVARDLFNLEKGWNMQPCIMVKDWMMASLDGRDDTTGCIVEIKCPGEKDHGIALQGKIPDHYYPQIQHQIYVADVQMAYYYSFDGVDGVLVEVKRDDEYIGKMIAREREFYECLLNKTPPDPEDSDYIERHDDLWQQCASDWMRVHWEIKRLQDKEEYLRKELVFLSGESNTRGAGVSLCQVKRKGNVDYSKVPELKGVDLDQYRKESINSWRITCE